MKIAILGGGLTGLTAAYYLQKKGYQVTIFEKEKILGGLASGFKADNWNWFLERTYHHIFSNDIDIINFTNEVEYKGVFFKEPITASLYSNPKQIKNSKSQNSKLFEICDLDFGIYPLDTPQDFMRFPLLSYPEKIRCAFVLAFLKLSPFLSVYEKLTAKEFLTKTMGRQGWNILWSELFRKKFGNYAENILASFIWARIKKRTKSLGYMDGGFQVFINHIEDKLLSMGVVIKKGEGIDRIEISNKKFDKVISTLPTPVLVKLGSKILPNYYQKKLQKLKYLHAVSLILETKEPIFDKTYWLSICDPKIPFMVVVQHTNFINKKNYGGNNIAYVAKYVNNNNKLLKMTKDEVIKYYLPHIKKIQNTEYRILNTFLFKAPFAQPIFDSYFINNKPNFITPVKNLYCANLDMTYPYDRGMNYAVKLGKQIAELISQ